MAFSDYKSKPSVAQLVGSYVDAYFSDELEEFNTEHPEIFNSRTGDLKTDFKDANRLIERIKSDKMLMHYMSGEKQKIMTGEILSVPFKIKIDSYLKDEAIVDLKVMKDFSDVWSTAYNSRVNFVEAYNYDIELSIFQEIVFQNTGKKLPCYLVCVTKEDPADIGLFEIPQDTLDEAMGLVLRNLPRYKDIAEGKAAPHRCEVCPYCRSTKQAKIISYKFAGMNGDELREEGFVCDDDFVKKGDEK